MQQTTTRCFWFPGSKRQMLYTEHVGSRCCGSKAIRSCAQEEFQAARGHLFQVHARDQATEATGALALVGVLQLFFCHVTADRSWFRQLVRRPPRSGIFPLMSRPAFWSYSLLNTVCFTFCSVNTDLPR